MADVIRAIRTFRWRRRPSRTLYHVMPLLILTMLHFVVFAPSIVSEKDGLPTAIIPWDFLDSYHRFLIFISDTLRAKALPIWFPYGNAGMPYFLNPQNQLWAPSTWLVSAFGGYSLVVAQRQVFLMLLLGGIGCYVLAQRLCRGRMAALFAAISYSFTAGRLGNTEHLDIVNAFSLYPWLFWGLLRVSRHGGFATPFLAFAGFWFLVSGYPGVVLLSPLWLLGWAAFLTWNRHRTTIDRRRFLMRLGLAGLLGLLLAAGYWLPLVANSNTFTRGDPMPVAMALGQSLTFKDLGSLVFAWTDDAIVDGARVDVSMRGVYFGIIALPLAMAALVTRRDRLTAALGTGALVAFLMALGANTSVRQAVNTYVPFLNVSRFPAVDARGVAVLCASLLGAIGFQSLIEGSERVRVFVTRSFGIIFIATLMGPWFLRSTLFSALPAAVFGDRVLAPIMSQSCWLAVALIVLARGVSRGRLAWVLCLLSVLDLGRNVQSNYNLLDQPMSATVRAELAREQSGKFRASAALEPRSRFPDLRDVRHNAGYTSKRFYLGSYGPFRLKTFETLLAAGFADWLTAGPRVVAFTQAPVPADGKAFAELAEAVEFKILRYVPHSVDYKITLSKDSTVVFNEVYFPGWEASVDGGPSTAMTLAAGGLRSIRLRAGSHLVRTWFSPKSFWVGAGLTATGLLILAVWVLWLAFRRRGSWRRLHLHPP